MHIIVIGGSGFLGQNLIKYLSNFKGYSLTNIDSREFESRSKATHIKKDIFIWKEIAEIFGKIYKQYGQNVTVFHLAGMSDRSACEKDHEKAIFSNVMLTGNLLSVAGKYKFKKFVFPSSAQVYKPKKNVPIAEEDELQADSVYAASKITAESMIRWYSQVYDINSYVLRMSTIYGHTSPNNTLFGTVLEQVKESKKEISLLNSNSQSDFVYIEDILKCFKRIIDHKGGSNFNVYNVSSSKAFSAYEIAEKICNEMDISKECIQSISQRTGSDHRVLSNEKIEKEIGWSPEYSIDDGIRTVIARIKG